MATDRRAMLAVLAAAALLLWPAVWNGYPIVFADTGTYLSQAIHRYAGWDRPVFYSLFMLPLHATVTVWPVIVVQALLAAWILRLVCRVLAPWISTSGFVCGIALLSVVTWLPWIVSELMPDLFTPLLILVVCLLAWVPELLSPRQQMVLVMLAAFMIASQQSSVPLACALLAVLGVLRLGHRRDRRLFRVVNGPLALSSRRRGGPLPATADQPGFVVISRGARIGALSELAPQGVGGGVASGPCAWLPGMMALCSDAPAEAGSPNARAAEARRHRGRSVGLIRRWLLICGPVLLAIIALCTANLAAHGRFALSPFGNVFLLARVIYDGPGQAVLRRDCPAAGWRLCPFIDGLPPTSDDFLWQQDGPLNRAGGPKAVSKDAGDIIAAALLADPAGEVRAAMNNTVEQLRRFASGDGLNPWPSQVSPWIEHDFPARERMSYVAARQQAGSLSVPSLLARLHVLTAVGGVIACVLLLPAAFRRRAPCAGFLLAILLALPVSAAITGGLSAPHDRYQSRIMWLPPFTAVVSRASLRRRTA